MSDSQPRLTAYGASWCVDCRRAKKFLDSHKIPYRWVDLGENPGAADIVRKHNDGRQVIPTLVFDDGSVLVEPNDAELAAKLGVTELKAVSPPETTRRVIIIGSGPAGYTAALYAARADLQPLVYAGYQQGGQLMLTTDVENYPGFQEGIAGPALMGDFRAQAERFGAEIRDRDVTEVDFTSRPYKVIAGEETEYAESVIVATGASAKWLGVPGEDTYRGYGVSSCATCDGFFFRGKRIAVVGGGDVAMEEAVFLSRFASELTVIHRRDTLRASKAMQQRAFDNPKLKFVWDTVVEEVLGEENRETHTAKVTGIRVRNLKSEETSILETDAVFVAIGHQPNTSIFQGKLPLDERDYAVAADPESTETTVPGIFVAGDVRDFRYRQAVTAAGDGCKAAMDAERWLEEHGVKVDYSAEVYVMAEELAEKRLEA
ncbi:MAG: thioredoxin-disulfide reductase [Chloroflexota bacterium]